MGSKSGVPLLLGDGPSCPCMGGTGTSVTDGDWQSFFSGRRLSWVSGQGEGNGDGSEHSSGKREGRFKRGQGTTCVRHRDVPLRVLCAECWGSNLRDMYRARQEKCEVFPLKKTRFKVAL